MLAVSSYDAGCCSLVNARNLLGDASLGLLESAGPMLDIDLDLSEARSESVSLSNAYGSPLLLGQAGPASLPRMRLFHIN